MNPTPAPADALNSALADLIHKTIEASGDAKDFIVSQLPDVIRQLLMWKVAESIVLDVVALLVFAGIVYNAVRLFRAWRNEELVDDNEGAMIAWSVLSAIGSIIGGIYGFALLNLTWLQIWLAPKVYLIEYARNITK